MVSCDPGIKVKSSLSKFKTFPYSDAGKEAGESLPELELLVGVRKTDGDLT